MGVYVHIPFCEQKCNYCDFHSIVVGDAGEFSRLVDSYLVSVRQEAIYYREQWGEKPVETLFFGGGTPSLVPPEKLASLIAFFLSELPFVPEPEISLEANPHSLTEKGARILAAAGVNRVSLGAQTFQDELLRRIGRLHRSEHVKESVRLLRQAGIDNINLDLMFGLPGQSLELWEDSLKQALALEPTHVSCYALTLEPETPLARWYQAGVLELPGEDEQADMYNLAREILRQAGYEHYEVSNFCLPGYECRHNLLYWHNLPYLGLGSGAAGFLNGCRYQNVADVEGYISSWSRGEPFYGEREELTKEQQMDETMMLGMRLLRGVSEREFYRRFNVSLWDVYGVAIQDLIAKGLVEERNGCLCTTERGLMLQNHVSGAFLR